MNLLAEARSILKTSDEGLRSLMEKAVRSGRYSEVAQLAEIAKALGKVSREWAGADASAEPERVETHRAIAGSATPATLLAAGKTAKRTSAIAADATPIYPKFERDGNRLIKIGWSKREKAEYEHKVSRDAALAVYLRLGKISTTAMFRMEELLPIQLPDGTEVPSYQSYLMLAWLRHINQIEKRANDSYQWTVEEISTSSFDDAWGAIPRRGVSVKGRKK